MIDWLLDDSPTSRLQANLGRAWRVWTALLRNPLAVVGALIVLAIAFGIVRPMLRGVFTNNGQPALAGEYLGGGGNFPVPSGAGRLAAAGGQGGMVSFDEKVAAAKNITGRDPARVAQLVRKWVAGNE